MKSDPSQIIDLHERAMEFADKARSARRAKDHDTHDNFIQKAYELEKKAALMIKSEESEPTRSVLHRSAASLAFRCKKYREAEWLIARALSGNPPGEILSELRRLSHKVYFQLRLEEKDLSVSDQEFSMNLDGNEIIEGLAPVDLITHRITKLKKIFWNTIRQTNGMTFGSNTRLRDQEYTLWVSAMEPGSIDVILKLGISGQMSLSNMGGFDSIFKRVLTNFDLLNQGEYDQLQDHISDNDYYCNFVALAKEIAPDGDNVVTVNLSALVEGQQRQVNFLRQQQKFNDIPLPDLLGSGNELLTIDETITVRGILQYADSMAADKEVKLRDADSDVTWKIIVPEALMKDVVQPHFDEEVEIVGKRMKRTRTLRSTLYLADIQRATYPK
ncbi:MAG: hypothetical protein OXG09_10265 [Chloroflexi bacterium]|nr:hypothetical protein [Chloroflexota bacterium]